MQAVKNHSPHLIRKRSHSVNRKCVPEMVKLPSPSVLNPNAHAPHVYHNQVQRSLRNASHHQKFNLNAD